MIGTIVLTGVIAGWGAWMTGRAVALSWQGPGRVVLYAGLLALADRFLHFALFARPLLDAGGFAGHLCYLLAVALLGWRMTRARRMVEQYPWLYRRHTPLSWRTIETSHPER